MKLRCRHRALALDRMALMGVLNVTPDSFSDGGRWLDRDAAVAHGLEMAAQGAAIIDVGGESTRPRAEPVPEPEELRRVVPVIEALVRENDVLVSIDTRKPAVARAAVEAGAAVINDTLGEAEDPSMGALAAETGAGIVAMHSRGDPMTMMSLSHYEDVVSHVAGWLRAKAGRLVDAGVPSDAIVLDPGFGFAKTAEQNLALLHRLEEVTALPHPVLVGTSRKTFVGKVLGGAPASQRLEGTIATVLWAWGKGARLARVHDVREVARAVAMTEAIAEAGARA